MAQNWVSFEEVKSRVSIRDVLAHYEPDAGDRGETEQARPGAAPPLPIP